MIGGILPSYLGPVVLVSFEPFCFPLAFLADRAVPMDDAFSGLSMSLPPMNESGHLLAGLVCLIHYEACTLFYLNKCWSALAFTDDSLQVIN